jgi:hypothetical protein
LPGSPWLPESPRWLLEQDRPEESFAIIQRLHRTKKDTADRESKKEFYQMRKQFEQDLETNKNASVWNLFKTAPNRKRTALGFILMFGNQFTVRIISG